MSELNVYHHELRPNEYDEFYLKYEADKVIADLEESHKMEVEQLLIEIAELKEIDSKNRSAYYKDLAMMAKDVEHHKYKRCVAMAAKYLWKRNYWRDSTPGYERQFQWENMAYKHYKRWLELAEKFKDKEAK